MNFDILAPHYRWMEWVLAGNKLQRARTLWLNEVVACRRVLLVGEGHGRFLLDCIKVLPAADITYVDSSLGMLKQAERACRALAGARVQFVHATLPGWIPTAPGYDLIVTNFFFDCFTAPQLAQIIPTLSQAAASDARWLVAEFNVPAHGWSRLRAQMILALAYPFFRVVTRLQACRLPCYEELLQQHGFRLRRRTSTEWGLLVSDMWQRG